jgi:hypothetical protein
MKRVLYVAGLGLLAAGVSLAQVATKQDAKSAGLGKPSAVSNEDLNIRAYIELLRRDVRKEAAQLVGEVMQLDAEDAAKFWPVYKEFEAEYRTIGDQIVALLKKYADHYDSINGAVADELANGVLSIERRRNDLKKKYYERTKSVLDPITAMRFLQVFNQLERVMDLQITAQLPVFGKE